MPRRVGGTTIELDTVEFLLQQGWQSLKRNGLMALAAICNIAVAFAVLSAFVLLAWNLEHMARKQTESAVITVELISDAIPADVEAAINRDLRVKRTKFLSRDEALNRLAERMGYDKEALKLVGNPLPDMFIVWPNNPDDIPALAEDIKKIKGVSKDKDGVRYGGQVTKKLLVVARGVKIAAAVLTILLGSATLLIVGATIGLTIYARRREIRIMQLVGATNWFIRVPFLIEGMLQGMAGAALAAVLVLVGYYHVCRYTAENLAFIDFVYSPEMVALFAAGTILAGIVFGAIGAMLAVRRYLKIV